MCRDQRSRSRSSIAADLRRAVVARLNAVADARLPLLSRTARAAEETIVRLHAVPEDHATAMLAARRELMDGALKAIEGVAKPRRDYLERLVIVVPADLARRHGAPSFGFVLGVAHGVTR